MRARRLWLASAALLLLLLAAWEWAARGLGLSTWAVFRRVQLPQLRVAVLGGTLLVALHVLAEFGALAMLRYPTFTTAVYDQYRATFNGPAASMLAGVLAAGGRGERALVSGAAWGAAAVSLPGSTMHRPDDLRPQLVEVHPTIQTERELRGDN